MEILKSTAGIFGLGAEKTQINEEERKSYRCEVVGWSQSQRGRSGGWSGQSVLAHSEAIELSFSLGIPGL